MKPRLVIIAPVFVVACGERVVVNASGNAVEAA
jgi:hypothetical protein